MRARAPLRLSVVVCAHDVEGYLAECVESLLAQDFDGFEIVAVDDCSTDSSGAVLDDLAARDDRLQVTHLMANVGLGLARNAGVALARGDYVLFLDGDDTMTPGSLTAIAARLVECGDPDVLLYDYERTFWWGERKRNRLARLLSQAGPQPYGLDANPDLLRIFPVAWNKAYRRDYLREVGLQFALGYYEDISWTMIALLRASTIGTLDRVCVHYRQRRFGGILQTRTSRHIEVIDQYATVFSHLSSTPGLYERWAPVVHRQLVNHLLSIWEHPRRLPADYRREFFAVASRRSRELSPTPRFAYSGDQRQAVKQWLLLHGHRRTLVALQWGAGVARTARGRGGRLRRGWTRLTRTLRGRALRLYYRWQLMLPVDQRLAVYSAYWNAGYQCNPRAVYEKAAEIAPEITGVWVIRSRGYPAPSGTPTVRPDTRAYWKTLARARFVVNNVNFPDEIVKRPGTTHLQTQHGTPLKYMGIDLREQPAANGGTNLGNLLRRSDRWDFNLSANPHSSRVWRRAFPCDYEMLELGYPRNDRLVTATEADTAEMRRRVGIPSAAEVDGRAAAIGPTVILYAPTHREFDRGFVSPLDVNRLAAALGDRFTILVRGHHKYSSATRPDPSDTAARSTAARIIDVSRHQPIEDLCIAADLLITDYSSIMFDFANLSRPIVLFTPDWETYRRVRGVYFDVVAEPPGVVAEDVDQLVELLCTEAFRTPEASTRLETFRRRFCPYDDGHAAERVVRRVFLDQLSS